MISNELEPVPTTFEPHRRTGLLKRAALIATVAVSAPGALLGCANESTAEPGGAEPFGPGGQAGEANTAPLECPVVESEERDGGIIAHATNPNLGENHYWAVSTEFGINSGGEHGTTRLVRFGPDGTADIALPDSQMEEIYNYRDNGQTGITSLVVASSDVLPESVDFQGPDNWGLDDLAHQVCSRVVWAPGAFGSEGGFAIIAENYPEGYSTDDIFAGHPDYLPPADEDPGTSKDDYQTPQSEEPGVEPEFDPGSIIHDLLALVSEDRTFAHLPDQGNKIFIELHNVIPGTLENRCTETLNEIEAIGSIPRNVEFVCWEGYFTD